MNKEVLCHRKYVTYGVRCCAVAKHIRLANVTSNAELLAERARTNTMVQARGVLSAALSSHCCRGPCNRLDWTVLVKHSLFPEHFINYFCIADIQI